MGRFLFRIEKRTDIRTTFFFFSTLQGFNMNSTVKSYLWFVGFMAVTKLVVAPVAKQLNIPMVSDLLG